MGKAKDTQKESQRNVGEKKTIMRTLGNQCIGHKRNSEGVSKELSEFCPCVCEKGLVFY